MSPNCFAAVSARGAPGRIRPAFCVLGGGSARTSRGRHRAGADRDSVGHQHAGDGWAGAPARDQDAPARPAGDDGARLWRRRAAPSRRRNGGRRFPDEANRLRFPEGTAAPVACAIGLLTRGDERFSALTTRPGHGLRKFRRPLLAPDAGTVSMPRLAKTTTNTFRPAKGGTNG